MKHCRSTIYFTINQPYNFATHEPEGDAYGIVRVAGSTGTFRYVFDGEVDCDSIVGIVHTPYSHTWTECEIENAEAVVTVIETGEEHDNCHEHNCANCQCNLAPVAWTVELDFSGTCVATGSDCDEAFSGVYTLNQIPREEFIGSLASYYTYYGGACAWRFTYPEDTPCNMSDSSITLSAPPGGGNMILYWGSTQWSSTSIYPERPDCCEPLLLDNKWAPGGDRCTTPATVTVVPVMPCYHSVPDQPWDR